MTETRLVTTTPLTGLRPLGLRGQAAVDCYRQLRAAIESRLGPGHAAVFARPERRSDGGIDWFTEGAGAICRLEELEGSARAAASADLQRKLQELSGLARSFQEGGSESSRTLGALLQAALNMAGPESLWTAGGRPVLTLWGFAPERPVPGLTLPLPSLSHVAEPLLVARQERAPAEEERKQAPAPEAPAAPVLASLAPAPAVGGGWWRWLLLALLLLIASLLAWKACAPLPPQAASAAPARAGEDLGRAQARGRELEQRLAELRRERDRARAACAVPAEERLGAGEPSVPPTKPAEGNAVQNGPRQPAEAPPPASPQPAPEPPSLPELAEVPRATPAPAPTREQGERSCPGARLPSEAPEVALVVDSSGSMEKPIAGAPTRLDAAKRAIGELLDDLPGDVDVGLVEFRDCERIRRDRFYSQGERDQLKAQVNALEPGRGTPLARSVERAAAILSSQVPGTIVVVTDGKDSCGGDPCAAAEEIARSRPNLTIHVIDIGSEGGSPAACMAQATGGKVYKPGSAVEFDRMVSEAGGQADAEECR